MFGKDEGYPPELTGPLTDAEREAMDRRRAKNAADDLKRKPLGPPNYRRGAAPPTFRSVGLEGVPGDLSDPNHPDRGIRHRSSEE
jgi:hypothetical protein